MNEGFRNLAVLLWALCAVNSNSYANDHKMIIAEEMATEAPTVVYGAAKRSNNETDEVIVEQPAGSGNPLGDPIVLPETDTVPAEIKAPAIGDMSSGGGAMPLQGLEGSGNEVNAPNVIGQPVVDQPTLGEQFQNTLEEANGQVYDVQAFPEQDLKVIGNPSQPGTIYSPNVYPGDNP